MQRQRSAMEAELRFLERARGHVKALEDLANTYPEGHDLHELLVPQQLTRMRDTLDGHIATLRESLSLEPQ